MAKMAFNVGGLGLPLGLAIGGLFIGIKSGTITKVFRVSSSAETGLGIDLRSTRPFSIDDSPVLNRLFEERIFFEVDGSGSGKGDIQINFKVYGSSGAVIYETERLAPVSGVSLGGWKVSGEPLVMLYPSDVVGPPDVTVKDGSLGERIAISLGLLSPSYGHLTREPEGIWEVTANNEWKYYYRFNSNGSVQWFYDFYDAKQRYWHFENGKGRWDIGRALKIDWFSGDTERWPIPFLPTVNGKWTTPSGDLYGLAAKRLI